MRYLIVLSAAAAALWAAGSALGGGWATVGFAPLPDGTAAGETWAPRITILQHGVTPLTGLSPVVTISGSGGARTFTATETSEPGVYEADVVFPSDGAWTVAVDSGFGDSGVTYGPVTIGGPAPADPASFPVLPVAVLLGGIALAVAAAFGIRQRRLTPAG
jgi:hypothetical protein